MTRVILVVLSLAAPFFFPWIVAVLLALAAAVFDPVIPLAVGILLDTLYHAGSGVFLPIFTLGGALVAAAAVFVRKQLKTGIIKE